MANCVGCGRELPAFSFGEPSDLCADCRSAAANNPSPPAPAPLPASRVVMARRWPPVTTVLVGINLAVFAAMALAGVSLLEPTTAQLLKCGANWGPLSLGPQPWRMLTSNYVHIGIVHILLNMWCLWNLGSMAERIFDRSTYVLGYLACGLAGSLASLWWHPLVVGAGASGAIFGMAGALIAVLYLGKLPLHTVAIRSTLKSLLIFAGYNLLYGLRPGTDNSAHVGGLVTGLVLGAVLARHLTEPPEVRERALRVIFVAVAVVLFAGSALVKQTNGYVVSLEKGLDALQKGRLDEAIRVAEEASAKKPNDRLVLLLLGSAYIEKHDYAKAEGAFQHVLQLEPDDFGAQYNLGLAQLNLGELDQAIASLGKAVQLNPKNPDAERALGQAYQAKGRLDEAQSAFTKADALRKTAKQR